MTRNTTIWKDLMRFHKLGLLLPIIGVVIPGLGILFGFIYQRTYYTHFGINILDYTSYIDFLGVLFREPKIALWVAVAILVAITNVYLLIRGNRQLSFLSELRELAVAFFIIYVAYLQVVNQAHVTAASLPVVSVEIRSSTAIEYLMIGRSGNTLFLCDSDAGNVIVVSESEIIKLTPLPNKPRDAKACWIES